LFAGFGGKYGQEPWWNSSGECGGFGVESIVTGSFANELPYLLSFLHLIITAISVLLIFKNFLSAP
jgi:hypothetical protein